MILSGLLIKESLQQPNILETLPIQITKTEIWTASNPTEFQPALWTAMTFEAEDRVADEVAEQLSHSLKPKGWFINASTASHVYVIFPNKVFRYTKGDQAARAEAARFGLAVCVPERQLDWGE